MIGTTHTIEKVSVDVNVTSTDTAEKIKSEINDFIQNEVLSIVESYLSDAAPEFDETTIQLDKVSLSIDTSSWNIHSKQMRADIGKEVKKKLDPILERAKDKALLLERKVIAGNDTLIDAEPQVYAKEERILKSFFHFLDHGTLPWWLSSNNQSKELFSEEVLKKSVRENAALVARELEKQKGNRRFRERLMKQFSSSLVTEMSLIKLSHLQHGNLTSSDLNKCESVNAKMNLLPNEVAKKVRTLIWQLAEEDAESVFQTDAQRILFEHIHNQFFANSTEIGKLDRALQATQTVMDFAEVASGNREDQIKLKSSFIRSLNEHVSEDVWTRIQQTKTYRKLISGLDKEFIKFIGTRSSEDKTASKEQTESMDDPSKQGTSLKEKDQSNTNNQQDNVDVHELRINEDKRREKRIQENSDSDSELEGFKKDLDSIDPTENDKNPVDFRLKNEQTQSEEINESTGGEENKSFERGGEIEPRNVELSNLDSESKKSNLEERSISNDTDDSILKTENGKDEKFKSEKTDKLREALKRSGEESSKDKFKVKATFPDAMYVNNAGLVLLNAFLPAMFKQLDLLTSDRNLRDPELSACILHYAATGREGDFEFEMAFEKYLCGIAPTESIERKIKLSDIQKDEVTKVLNSVLTHWGAMNGKPAALLQNEFLSRTGKLITEKSNHRLIIEKKSFDLLMDSLPWSYSIVQLPWKKELIFVEW